MAKITIFGLAGTGKGTTAKLLSEILHYENMSTGNMFRAMAEEQGMTLNEFENFTKSDDSFDRKLDNKVVDYGKTHDNFIFESRLAWHFIPDSFKIKLKCDFDTRVARIASREDKSLDLAKQETEERENLAFYRYKDIYNLSGIDNDKNFDLIVDTGPNNPEKVVEIILEELKNKGVI